MGEWVSQGEAVKLLARFGDVISQPALSQYLSGHPEVPRNAQGPGRPTMVDWDALKRSRSTRMARGPSEAPATEPSEPDEVETPPAATERPRNEFGDRKAKADVERAEAEARRSRILADEAEGRSIPKEAAASAFMAAGAALVRSLEENRRLAVETVRAAKDTREADLAMKAYERALRTAFAGALADIAAAATPETAAAQ